MTPLEILKKARSLIEDKSRWTQHVMAKNINDENCGFQSDEAVKFCAIGACAKVSNNIEDLLERMTVRHNVSSRLHKVARKLYKHIDSNIFYIQHINDQLSHEDVMKCFDYAISELEKENGSGA